MPFHNNQKPTLCTLARKVRTPAHLQRFLLIALQSIRYSIHPSHPHAAHWIKTFKNAEYILRQPYTEKAPSDKEST